MSFVSEILAKKLNIQKVVVYVTDLDEKLICQYRILRSTRTNGQIEDWNKKMNLLRFAAYGFVVFFVHFWKWLLIFCRLFPENWKWWKMDSDGQMGILGSMIMWVTEIKNTLEIMIMMVRDPPGRLSKVPRETFIS